MKQTPELDRIQKRMEPGELTLHGFLGDDKRKLVDILEADRVILGEHGVTSEQIAERLAYFSEKGVSLMEEDVTVDERYRVCVRDDRGLIPSPWGDGLFGKGESELTDTQTGHKLRWNELTAHLIRAHGFFGGKGSDYRIDPEVAIAAFDLTAQPDNDDTPETPTP